MLNVNKRQVFLKYKSNYKECLFKDGPIRQVRLYLLPLPPPHTFKLGRSSFVSKSTRNRTFFCSQINYVQKYWRFGTPLTLHITFALMLVININSCLSFFRSFMSVYAVVIDSLMKYILLKFAKFACDLYGHMNILLNMIKSSFWKEISSNMSCYFFM